MGLSFFFGGKKIGGDQEDYFEIEGGELDGSEILSPRVIKLFGGRAQWLTQPPDHPTESQDTCDHKGYTRSDSFRAYCGRCGANLNGPIRWD